MKIETFDINGPKLITLDAYDDDRGFFTERFRIDRFKDSQLPTNFVQDNFSRSNPNVLRGLHYQYQEPQGKMVTALNGQIYDVAVDIRASSPTYGQWLGVKLSGDKPQWFWVPPGFAHGFCVLGEGAADVLYKVDAFYNKSGEDGLSFDDPSLSINWPVTEPIISEKDRDMQSFKDYMKAPKF